MGGGPELGLGPGRAPPPLTGSRYGPRRYTVGRGETAPGPGRTPYTKKEAYGPVRPGRPGWRDRVRGPRGISACLRSQSAALAFLPSRGADPPQPSRCARGAEIQVWECPPPSLSPRPLIPDSTLELKRGVGSRKSPVYSASFAARRSRVEGGMLSSWLLSLPPHRPQGLRDSGRIPLDSPGMRPLSPAFR